MSAEKLSYQEILISLHQKLANCLELSVDIKKLGREEALKTALLINFKHS